MTSLAEEREVQAQWRLRPECRELPWFDQLLANEFLDPARLNAMSGQLLSRMIDFAVAQVPYYGRLFAQAGLQPADVRAPGDLPRLPVLTKQHLHAEQDALRAKALPRGERQWGWFSSSGTTGRPANVLHTVASNQLFGILAQRQYRWFRFDPANTLATIRLASQLPPGPDRRPNPVGATLRLPAWRYAGRYFATGPHLCFNVENPVEDQLAWLAEHRPDYLQSYSETLEHLAFACDGRWPAPGLRRLMAISEQLTPSMRRRIEETLGAEVEQNYGLNEVGIVAIRCTAGRYHVHVEHCLAEVVDDAGQPCLPGTVGRLVVTALRNPAMPLIRYDTGDLARAEDGPCPCGRTSPSFGEVVGRYSRIAYLPEGTLPRVGALRAALESMPPAEARNLRQFQVHQDRDGGFELRLVEAGDLPEGFAARVREAWQAATGDAVPLRIVRVDAIARSPGGKFQDFTSDFMPAPDRDAAPAAEAPGRADAAIPPPTGGGMATAGD